MDKKKDELVKQQWRKEEAKRRAEDKRKTLMDSHWEEKMEENFKLVTAPTYDIFGRDILILPAKFRLPKIIKGVVKILTGQRTTSRKDILAKNIV